MQTDACQIVASQITHTRYGPPAHLLQRAGLSILIDLDRLEAADVVTWNVVGSCSKSMTP
ncbi:MAG: hypothetical protein VXW06_04960 [Pseudomonadota bacterium]|nr:hypothetical protein [Pseudomonadota bacterium]